jgi:hypothetical protein
LLRGVGRVLLLQMVSAWKESGKLKDLKIEELNFQLGQAAAQLEVAKQEAAALQQQLADTSTKVGAGRHIVCLATAWLQLFPGAVHPTSRGACHACCRH